MPKHLHNDPIFQPKKVVKTEIKFKIALNEEQKEAAQMIRENAITVINGQAGSGKTLVACQVAATMLLKREEGIEKIIICRPTVSKEDIGFLPGDMKDKLDPWLQPIYQNLFMLMEKKQVEELIKEGKIEICPFSFMQGRTFCNAVIIADEAQNLKEDQTEMLLGRLGKGSKLVICGDVAQVMLDRKGETGWKLLAKFLGVTDFAMKTLKTNHRHPIVEKLLAIIDGLKGGQKPDGGWVHVVPAQQEN